MSSKCTAGLPSSQGGLSAGELELLVLGTELGLPALQVEPPNLCARLLKWKCSEQAGVLPLLELNLCVLMINEEMKALVALLCFCNGEVELQGLHVDF